MMDLKRMRFLLNRLPMARFRVERAMSTATRATAIWGGGMPRGGGLSDPVGRGAEMIAIAREEYQALKKELEELQREAEAVFQRVEDPLQRQFLEMRYLKGMTVRRIALMTSYSERHVFRVLKEAEEGVGG